MRICVHEQGTDGWLRDRLGCPSGSNFSKLITATGKPSTSADGYINQMIAERMMGKQASEVKVTSTLRILSQRFLKVILSNSQHSVSGGANRSGCSGGVVAIITGAT